MDIITTVKGKLSSFQIIILGFAGVILGGAVLLMLPISSKAHQVTPFIDALFTSTSAVCVTGLVVRDTSLYWSYFGQGVILVLIQMGGLGVVTVASFLAVIAGRKISLMQRQTMQSALSAPQVGGVVRLTSFVFRTAFAVELIGFLVLLPFFCKRYGLAGIWMSVFHSISAFCNAGFDLMGGKTGAFSSLTFFQDSPFVTIVFGLLIFTGGIGFLTWDDIVKKKFHIKEYRMQSKVILATSLLLLVIPAICFFFFDFSDLPLKSRICQSMFQAVTPRTAGFNTADLTKMTSSGLGIMMILMLIGGSPGSTAGGMKTTTAAVLFGNTIAVFRRRDNAKFFGRRIADHEIKNASTIFFMYLILAIGGALIISVCENLPMSTSLFETISAIGTVGLTLGITSGLGVISKLVLMLLMFFGRVGGLTLIYAAFSRRDTFISKYPLEHITVG